MSSPGPTPADALRLGLAGALVAAMCALSIAGCALLLPFRAARVRWSCFAVRLFGPAALRALGARLRLQNGDRLGAPPAIFVLNHTSTLDTFLSFALCPPRTATCVKKEVRGVPMLGLAYRLSGHLLVDRADGEAARAAMDELGRFVRAAGLSIWILPEGTRSKTGALQPFKKGFVHLAIATGLPVVPVVVHGAAARWPLGGMRLLPGDVRVDVLPDVPTGAWTAARAGEHAEEVRALVAEALTRAAAAADAVPGPRRAAAGGAATS